MNIIISLGGSIISPSDNLPIDWHFLIRFRDLVKKYSAINKFIIICGGGNLARTLQKKALKLKRIDKTSLDWLGIYATRINALAVKNVFNTKEKLVEEEIITKPTRKINFKAKGNILIAAGWKPGFSTDYDAVLLMHNIGADLLINITNVDYVYNKNPKLKGAKPIKKMTWSYLSSIVGNKWKPGLNMPFDPIAVKEAEKLNLKVLIIGKELKNLKKVLDGKKFKGTVIK